MDKKKHPFSVKKQALRRAMVNALEIPAEVGLDIPKITMTGNY